MCSEEELSEANGITEAVFMGGLIHQEFGADSLLGGGSWLEGGHWEYDLQGCLSLPIASLCP